MQGRATCGNSNGSAVADPDAFGRNDRIVGLVRIDRVGGYAIQPVWADGHSSGLFSFDYLRLVADAP